MLARAAFSTVERVSQPVESVTARRVRKRPTTRQFRGNRAEVAEMLVSDRISTRVQGPTRKLILIAFAFPRTVSVYEQKPRRWTNDTEDDFTSYRVSGIEKLYGGRGYNSSHQRALIFPSDKVHGPRHSSVGREPIFVPIDPAIGCFAM